MREFFASRGIQAATVAAQEADSPLVAVNAADDEVAAIVAADEEGPERHVRESTVQKIASLNVAQRMTLAMKGSREERAVLVRDPNKIVAVAVLSSPKLTETEVESIAKMANVSDEILRMISGLQLVGIG